MSGDVLNQIVNQAKASPFCGIQLDASTDVASHPQLSLFIGYISNGKVSENLFFKALLLHCKGEDIFKCLNAFSNKHSISWKNSICTDGTTANTGINSRVVKHVKDKVPDLKWMHGF